MEDGKQIYKFNVCDLELLKVTCQHSKIDIKLSIKLIDLMAKIYLNQLIWS